MAVAAIPLVFGVGGQLLGGYAAGALALGATGTTIAVATGGMAGAYLGSMMFPQETEKTSLPKIDSYPVQMTLSGSPIPIVRGTKRVAGTVIVLGDLHPYTITHKSGGGGKGMGGGGGGSKVVETHYKRSFLIGICEGPANVNSMWKGDQPVPITDCTIFKGDGNVGLAVTVGLEFANWKHLCCVWFEEYDLGTTQTIPQFTFEVSSDAYFRRADIIAGGNYLAGTGSIVEAYNIFGQYSHVFISGYSGVQKRMRIVRHATSGNYCIGHCTTLGFANIFMVSPAGTIVWQYTENLGGDIAILSSMDGYLYIGAYHSTGSIYNIRKINPDTGAEIWQKNVGDNYVTGIVEESLGSIYVLVQQNKIYKLDSSNGNTLWQTSVTFERTGDLVKDANFLYSYGIYGTTARLWCDSTDDSVYPGNHTGYTFNDSASGGMQMLPGTVAPYIAYVYVGVNEATQYVAKMGLALDEFGFTSFVLLDTYLINGTIYDIKLDIDSKLLVCHDRSTDEGGHVGHITKLNQDLVYGGCIDFENNRVGFIRTFDRGPGTVIGDPGYPSTVNPVDAMLDIMTDKRIGGGIDSSLIDMDDYLAAQQHCADNGIGIAIELNTQRPMLDWMDYIQSHYFGYTRLG